MIGEYNLCKFYYSEITKAFFEAQCLISVICVSRDQSTATELSSLVKLLDSMSPMRAGETNSALSLRLPSVWLYNSDFLASAKWNNSKHLSQRLLWGALGGIYSARHRSHSSVTVSVGCPWGFLSAQAWAACQLFCINFNGLFNFWYHTSSWIVSMPSFRTF